MIFVSAKGQCDAKYCGTNAECINFVCVCKKGYYGNGYRTCARKLDCKKILGLKFY